MRTALLQFDVKKGDPAANMALVGRKCAELCASASPPDVIVLPELWSTGYDLENARRLASPLGEREAQFLGALASRHDVAFAGGSVLSLENGSVFNRAQAIGRDGTCLAGYNKIHLFRPMGEADWLSPGSSHTLFSLGGMRCALAVCYDIRFPELIRSLSLDGAEALFLSAEWPSVRIGQWKILLQARAVENQMYVIACNRCGSEGGTVFGGCSMIVSPSGEICAEAGSGRQSLTADIDPGLPASVRASFPVLCDRVPAAYALDAGGGFLLDKQRDKG